MFLSGCNTALSEASSSLLTDERFIGTFGISQEDCNLRSDPNQFDWIFNISENKMITEMDGMYFYCDYIDGKYLNPNELQANFSCVNANLLDETSHTINFKYISDKKINIIYPKTSFSPGKTNELVRCSSTQNDLASQLLPNIDIASVHHKANLLNKNMDKEIIFYDLRMLARAENGIYILDVSVESGFAEYNVIVDINAQDFEVIENDKYRATLLKAALHRPFQLKETALNKAEQRYYLDMILHANEAEVNTFLTKLDHGQANGAISNMVRKASNRDIKKLRDGDWFY